MNKKIFALLNCICLCSYAVGLPATGSLQALTVEKCGTSILPPSSPDRIVGGNIARHGQYPWIVSLRENSSFTFGSGFKHACGAAILNENWIITAAHCIDYVTEPWKYEILVGLHKMSEDNAPTVQRIKISKVVKHKEFFIYESGRNDIALLKTAEPIDIAGSKGYVNGICLPNTDKDPEGYATVIGWGHTSEGGVKSDALREVVLPIVHRDSCKLVYKADPDFAEMVGTMNTMICAGMTKKDACQVKSIRFQFDSGGPLFQTNSKGVSTLIGIVSFGNGCGHENYPGVYTKVSSYHSWIENVVATN